MLGRRSTDKTKPVATRTTQRHRHGQKSETAKQLIFRECHYLPKDVDGRAACDALFVRGPTVLDRDRSNKPRGRTRTEVSEKPGTMVLKSRISLKNKTKFKYKSLKNGTKCWFSSLKNVVHASLALLEVTSY